MKQTALFSALVVVLLALSACTTQPLEPVNATNVTEDLVNNLPDPFENETEENDEADTETSEDDEVEEDVTEEDNEEDRSGYAAVIEGVEGETIRLATRATDPDGDEVELTFEAPFDDEGEWETEEGDAGEYEITVTASDGQEQTEAEILVVVRTANSAPVIEGPDVIEVEEGETIDLGVFTITDLDDDEFVVSYSGFMDRSEYRTTFEDAGEHTVRISAEDTEGNLAMKTVTIDVEDVNRRPTLRIDDRTIDVTEGETAVIVAEANDADGDDITIEYGEPFNEDGEWATEEGDADEYEVTVTASDGQSSVDRLVIVTVHSANRPPVIEILDGDEVVVEEGETVNLEAALSITDPEGDDVDVSYSGWMDSATRETDFDDSGEYEVTVTATDGSRETSMDVTVVVENVNRAPVFIRPA